MDENSSGQKLSEHLTTVTHWSKILTTLLFILLPLVGFAGGWKYHQLVSGSTNPPVSTSPVSTKVLPTPAPLIIPQGDKSLYINRKHGFSFVYPTDWTLGELNSGDADINGVILNIFGPDDGRGAPGYYDSFRVSLRDKYDYLDDLIADPNTDYIQKTGIIVVDGRPGYEVSIGGAGQMYGVLIQTKLGIYELDFPRAATKSKLVDSEKQVLSSFKFFSKESSKSISETEAVKLVQDLPEVRQWYSLFSGPGGVSPTTGGKPAIMVDHKEGNLYIIRVYENVSSDGHSATFNWYNVHDTTGEILKELN